MDLIDRQAAIDELNREYRCGAVIDHCGLETAMDIISELPPAEPESTQWIPVTERLPEVKQRVIVQYADGCIEIKRCIDAGHLQCFYARAVAWMPLPEPYRG